MQQATGIAVVFGFWSSLYLLDVFLKAKRRYSRSYLQFLDGTGLSVSICQLRWFSTWFNRLFVRIAQWKPGFLRAWFTMGIVFALVAMVMSVFLLSLLVINTIRRQPVEQQVLTPVMPGVNLPASQITYYLLTLLVCGILHEVGHAVAAVREQVRVNGFGIFVLLLYPGAYVDLSTEHLQIISPLRQLRIYCAGVWHNFIIVLASVIFLFVLPWLLVPFYTVGNAVVLTHVLENSAVSGPLGLAVGDHVTSIGDCRVTSVEDWQTCIRVSLQERNSGYCMSLALIDKWDTATKSLSDVPAKDCCNRTSSTHLCFSYHTRASPDLKYACLPARSTTDRPPCKLHSDCFTPNLDMACVLPATDNTTKLLRVFHGRKPPLLFLGHPLDLHYSVGVSNYVPASAFIPINLPYVLETFCKYLISLSGALIILNVVPCYALDGQWICHAFIELSLRSTFPDREARGAIYTVVILFGTLLLLTNVFIAMCTLFF
ncbi:membrane-bound transcription factor site-2 protease-like [Liolophura sinensis]|uniref:membrane-bound transcription factor site-2 protease-like n=1 Tax=Liolophura sinensis TaxID=3198878 RepID=UPI003158CF1F